MKTNKNENMLENQLKERLELLEYYTTARSKNKVAEDMFDKLIAITLSQIEDILGANVKNSSDEYLTAEGVKAKEEMNKIVERVDSYPIDISRANLEDKSILVVDINYLLSEFKGDTFENTKLTLETLYGYKVLLIDSSRQNLQGANNEYKPVYFI